MLCGDNVQVLPQFRSEKSAVYAYLIISGFRLYQPHLTVTFFKFCLEPDYSLKKLAKRVHKWDLLKQTFLEEAHGFLCLVFSGRDFHFKL